MSCLSSFPGTRFVGFRRSHGNHPLCAASIAAMSIFVIFIIASNAHLALYQRQTLFFAGRFVMSFSIVIGN